jgi:hypothetical protein
METLLKRWYVWLGLVLLLGLAGSVALIYATPGRITKENFDRIQDGMSLGDVEEVLGKDWENLQFGMDGLPFSMKIWNEGPGWIHVGFREGQVVGKSIHFASVRENLHWYAKKGAEKIGVKWD